jgi:hypothetical protein
MKPSGKSYDEFFAARSAVTRIQFWGLVLVGGSLITTGFALLAMILLKLSPDPLDAGFAIIWLFLPVGICGAIIYFGVLHIKRALVGTKSKRS